ncbi:uncharacterized protein KY384_006857 [Bacidia gigantensis]|uniref:uncharacterized protein n=1 Tax=Bacidia gigantensis TaxID=2732470 RepID=UPI001D043BCE|nr:uncharacterized protein KY384_006857 [Bacidia gigantensis]KAG8527941.1 hypothetical protein KY384_006857 [Bacidia gigantensis]
MSLRDACIGAVALLPAYIIPNKHTTWYKVPVTLIVAYNAALFVLSWSITSLLRHTINHESSARRTSIRASVTRELASLDGQATRSPNSSNGDWERVSNDSEKSGEVAPLSKEGYDGFIGFFHPFAFVGFDHKNAGGGGERVLWAAIQATQNRWPKAICVVYTGDHQSDKTQILKRVKTRFDIDLYSPTISFLYLNSRAWVVAGSYPRFTLLLQSLGSINVAYEALSLLKPDIFIDTMGYSFSTWFCKFLFPEISIGSYVHYPFIGTHMVDSLASGGGKGVNAGKGKGLRGLGKKVYWHCLLRLYKWTGTSIDIVMTNSTWTQNHMQRIWGPGRAQGRKPPAQVVYPPCSVEEIIDQTPLEGQHALPREKLLLCIAQFRPEKNHELLIESFAQMTRGTDSGLKDARLILVGSVRDSEDETLVYKLRLLAKELKLENQIEFRINTDWGEILEWLKRSWVGVNGMWCEHFGIGVVEYQAAGLISVVNDSGGPKEDIVVDLDGGPTGYHASTATEYASRFVEALTLSPESTQAMRKRARSSSKRFTTDVFSARWTQQLEQLIAQSKH